jgi:hypothetical protein
LFSWGFNFSGELGQPTRNNTFLVKEPTMVEAIAQDVCSVASGAAHSLCIAGTRGWLVCSVLVCVLVCFERLLSC